MGHDGRGNGCAAPLEFTDRPEQGPGQPLQVQHACACDREGGPVKMGQTPDHVRIERQIHGRWHSRGGIARQHVSDLCQAPVEFGIECCQVWQ